MNKTLFGVIAFCASATAYAPVVVHATPTQDMVEHELLKELRAIRTVESSDGKNTHHKMLFKGMHRLTRAGGDFGVMPKTAKFVIGGSKHLRKKFGSFLNKSDEEVTAELNRNREFDKDVALTLWTTLRKEFSVDQAAWAWYHGWGSARTVSSTRLAANPYVVKFKLAYSRVSYQP